MSFLSACVLGLLWSRAEAIPAPGLDRLARRSDSSSHACGDLLREANDPANGNVAWAVDVYNCWITVPFNPAVGTRFVQYWNTSLQFQATLDYLKEPPASYQQPAADLVAGLNDIQTLIDNGGFANEYQFEAALQNVLYSANDAHVSNAAGLLSSFSFGSYYGLTSLSLDGIGLPKVYITDDLIQNQTKGDSPWQPSAISEINGTNVVDYLTRFAALNSFGTSEPHADWNSLMDSPVIDVLDESYTLWGGSATFYPGDTFSYTFENGSTLEDEWLASYYNPGDTGPLETGGDFYNFFVLGFYPASYSPPPEDSNATQTNSTAAPAPAPTTSFADLTNAYPQPDIWQDDLTDTGFTTGYFLHDASLAVLSLPTFWADGTAIQAFTDTVSKFLAQSKAAGMKRVLIDLQQNDGGDVLLAYSVFRQFFPSIDPYGGSVMRAHPLANTMGEAITTYWETLNSTDWQYQDASADEWIATTRINAETGRNFSSWNEFFGPYFDGIGNLTAAERLNTSNYYFDYSTFGQEDPPAVLLSPYSGESPYAAEDIVMLSDGLCSSACSLFMEMMHHDAGVKTVVIGGRPTYGPMQTPSGSRGARYYDLSELDTDLNNTIEINTAYGVDNAGIPDRTNQDIYIYDAAVSLRAQIREGEAVPLAMQFEAADCRIFLTPETFNNFTNLWKYAASALFTSPQFCVQESTGYATTTSSSPLPPPAASHLAAVNYSNLGMPLLDTSHAGVNIPFLVSDGPMPDVVPGAVRPVFTLDKFQRANTPTLYAKSVSTQQLPSKAPVVKGGNVSKSKRISCRASPLCGLRRRRR